MAQNPETANNYRWVVLGVLWITYIVVFLNRLSIGPLAPFLKRELDITSAQVGMIMSAAALGSMVTQIPIGRLVDRIGARWPMVVGELIAGTCMLMLFFAPSYIWLLILMFAAGLGLGCLMPSSTQAVIVWFPLKERATVMGLKQTAVNIGGVITAATLPIVALTWGWRYGFLFLGIIALVIGVTVFILYKEPSRPASLDPTDSADLPRAVPLLELLKNREILLVSLCGLCFAWVEFAVIGHLVLYLTEWLLVPVVMAGGMLAIAEVAGAIARPGSGLLSDRVFGGHRKPVLIMMAIVASAMCLIIGFFGSYLSWAIYPILFLLGVGGIGFGGMWLTMLGEFGGRHGVGTSVGLATVFSMCGSTIGPIAFGYIVDISGSYELSWFSLAFMAALCVLLFLFVREERRKI
ncbi:MFS transporter [Chloroflexota bacterium]